MSEVFDEIAAQLGASVARIMDERTRFVLTEMLPRDRFSVVAVDEILWINPRTEWTATKLRWVCDGVDVRGARVLL